MIWGSSLTKFQHSIFNVTHNRACRSTKCDWKIYERGAELVELTNCHKNFGYFISFSRLSKYHSRSRYY